MNHGKKRLFLSRELIIELKLFESTLPDPPWPDLQKKSSENRSIGQKKNNFIAYKKIIK